MRRFKRKYETQGSYDTVKLNEQRELAVNYGVASKRQLYMFKTQVRNIKRSLRNYGPVHRCTHDILERLKSYGICEQTSTSYYDTILDQLTVEHLLSRRLQVMVRNAGYKLNQSRQKIVHGFVKVCVEGVEKTIRRPNLLIKNHWTVSVR